MNSPNNDINKDELYGRYQAAEDWRAKLYRRATHKSLDIPDDEMNIYTDNRKTSNGSNSLLTLALGAVLGGGGIWLGQMLSKPVIPAAAVTPTQQQLQPATNQDTTTTIGLGRIEDYLGQSGATK